MVDDEIIDCFNTSMEEMIITKLDSWDEEADGICSTNGQSEMEQKELLFCQMIAIR